MFRAGAAGSVAAIVVHPLSSAPVRWDPVARRIVIDEQLLGEDPKLVAATIAYGLTRAEQDGRARERAGMRRATASATRSRPARTRRGCGRWPGRRARCRVGPPPSRG